jgi:acylphosphatase
LNTAVHVIVKGRVQGVGFRYFVQDSAQNIGLTGWVRNLPDGDVEAEAVGSHADLDTWLNLLRQGPPLARVDHLQIDWRDAADFYSQFSIR